MHAFRESEIEHFHAVRRGEDVAGLQVAVDDAFGVRSSQGMTDLNCVFDDPGQRHRAMERRTVDVLHDEIIRPYVIQSADIGMVERSYGSCFLAEALAEAFLGELERDCPVQTRVECFPHLTHAASSSALATPLMS